MVQTNGKLSIAEARRLTPAVDRLGPRAQRAREAIADSVTDEDIAAIMRKQVEKARDGDVKAAKFVVDQIAGKAPAVSVSVGVRGGAKERRSDGATEGGRGPRIVQLPDGDGDDDDEGPAAEDDARTVGDLRRSAARLLGERGALPRRELRRLLGVHGTVFDAVIDCPWFAASAKGTVLTGSGMREGLNHEPR